MPHVDDRQPNLFIPGGPKCGTTSIVKWLAAHPRIFVSAVKEPHHYNTDHRQVYYPDRYEYLSLYDGAETHDYRIDASVWYLHSRCAVENILADCHDARFIVCLRNPVDIALSLHSQYVNKTAREHVKSFREAWELSDQRLLGRDVSKRVTDPQFLAYKYSCRVGSQAKRLLDKVNREHLHFVVLDDVKENKRETLEKMLNFLGLASEEGMVFTKANPRRAVKSQMVQRILRHMKAAKKHLGITNLSLGVLNTIARLNAAPVEGIDVELRKRVTEYFREEIEIIFEITGQVRPEWLASLSRGDG